MSLIEKLAAMRDKAYCDYISLCQVELVAGLAGVSIAVVEKEIREHGEPMVSAPPAKKGQPEAVGDVVGRVMQGVTGGAKAE